MASTRSPLDAALTLRAAGALSGAGTTLDVTGAAGVLIVQINNGAAGTAGVDTIQVSKDGGTYWAAATIRNSAGAAIATGILNVAGDEPVGAALFTMHPRDGQMSGPTLIRCNRGTAWVTGAPSAIAITVGI